MNASGPSLGEHRFVVVQDQSEGEIPGKAGPGDFIGRFREIISDPLNVLIERHPFAGVVDQDNRVTLHNGLKVPFSGAGSYYGPFSYILALNRGVHEPLEEYIFQEMLKRVSGSPMMLELGAYWGHYSMWLKKTHPQAKVILVEPEERLQEAGRSNFRFNGLDGEFIQAFVGPGKFEVDAFLKERNVAKLDILHADIQGYENVMLQACRDALSKKAIDYLFISTHGDNLTKQVVTALRANGYRVEVVSDFERHTNSFDGFVFASSPLVAPLLPDFQPFGRMELAGAASRAIVERLATWSVRGKPAR